MKLNEITSDPQDTIQCDIPLFIRLLEYAREDAKTDVDLHNLTENAIRMSKAGTLTMDNYDALVSKPQHQASSNDESTVLVVQP